MITGRCECGAVTFQASEGPLAARACWCRTCQRIGGGSGTVNAFFKAAAVTVSGETADFASAADSGNILHRLFCPHCGTPLFVRSEARPQFLVVRVGVLDDPEQARPSSTIWTASAPSWACIDPALPRVDRQPPPIA
jgi:hypothetical protein